MCYLIFISALFIIDEIRKQPVPIDRRMCVCVYIMYYGSLFVFQKEDTFIYENMGKLGHLYFVK
jgi:hypothetical protein